MREYRMSKDAKEHYTSLEELRGAWGLKPFVKKTSDAQKLKKQKENFLNKHLCKTCKNPMEYIGGNQMCCKNPKCPGIANERIDKDGNTVVVYTPSFDLLDDTGSEIAGVLLN